MKYHRNERLKSRVINGLLSMAMGAITAGIYDAVVGFNRQKAPIPWPHSVGLEGIGMTTVNLLFLCPHCEKPLKKPGYLNRAWCSNCEMYLIPNVVEAEEPDSEGIEVSEGADHAFNYTTWRPRSNNYQLGETAEHRFMYVKRKDRLVKGAKGVSYKAKCTCKKWNNPNGFTNRRAAHRQWEAHMAEVEKQQQWLL